MKEEKTKSNQAFVEKYNSFIGSLEIREIRIKESTISTAIDNPPESEITISIKEELQGEPRKDGKEVFYGYVAEFKMEHEDNELLSIVSVYEIALASDIVPTKKVMKTFAEKNLGNLVWPYFREYVHCSMQRMGLPPIMLPVRPYFHR